MHWSLWNCFQLVPFKSKLLSIPALQGETFLLEDFQALWQQLDRIKSCKTAFVRPPWMDSTTFDGLGCCDESNLQWRQADSGILFPALRLEEPHCRQFCSCHVMLQHVYWWCFCQHQMDPLESLQRLVLLCTLKYVEVSKIGVQDGSRMFQTSPYHTRSLPFDFRWVDLWAMSGPSRQRKAILLFRGSAPDHLPSLRTVRCRCAGRPKDEALGPDEVQMKCRWSADEVQMKCRNMVNWLKG